MTYLEKITYLTGNFIQLSQFVLKNAYRLVSLLEAKENETVYTKNSTGSLVAAETMAEQMVKENTFLGSEAILLKLKEKGISEKLFKEVSYVAKKRDYVVSCFYLDNAKAIATEEIAVYNSKINELQEYCDKATAANQHLAKECDKLYH